MILTQEFHADHQKMVAALFKLRQAIAAHDGFRVRSNPGTGSLTLWMERLSPGEQKALEERMVEVRRQGTKFSEYYRERQRA